MLKKIILLLLFPVVFAFAQTDVSSRSLSGVQKATIPQSHWLVHFEGRFPTILKIYDQNANTMIDLPEQMVRSEAAIHANVVYGLFRKTNFFAAIPFRWVDYYSPDLIQKKNGPGDLTLGLYQQLLQKANGFSLNGELAVIAPTGAHKNLAKTEAPLGDGAFAARLGVNGSAPFKRGEFVYAVNYLYRGTNSNDMSLGDRISLLACFQKELQNSYGHFVYEAGLYSGYYMKNSAAGSTIPNSDAFSTGLFAGFGYYFTNNLRFDISLPVTAYKRDGLLTDYSVYLQIDYSLKAQN